VKSVVKKNAFTIVELLVAMTLLVILLGLSGMVFNTTVQAHRAAGATIEITRNLRAIRDQLNTDFKGLRKDGEIFLAWVVRPAIDENGYIDKNENGTPDYQEQFDRDDYQKFDRIIFFANGDYQTLQPQALTAAAGGGSKIVQGNLARISYMLANNSNGTEASLQPDRAGRILARTEHIVTADVDLPLFPDPAELLPAVWDPAVFEQNNFFDYEYQTMTMADWTNMSNLVSPYVAAKDDILTILSDIDNILGASTTTVSGPGPTVDFGLTNTYRNLFCSGVGEFSVQIWLDDEKRWYPQIDPNGDGNSSDTDYRLDGAVIDQTYVGGLLYPDPITGANDLKTNSNMSVPNRPLKFTALKFTFTLYDSKGIIPGGKTFTHIVYIDN